MGEWWDAGDVVSLRGGGADAGPTRRVVRGVPVAGRAPAVPSDDGSAAPKPPYLRLGRPALRAFSAVTFPDGNTVKT